MIHAAGGVAVWAHPFWDFSDPRQVAEAIRSFHALGIDGIEAFYITHDAEQTRVAAGAAAELGLLRTGSSDFHGPEHPLFHRFLAHELHGLTPELGPLAAESAQVGGAGGASGRPERPGRPRPAVVRAGRTPPRWRRRSGRCGGPGAGRCRPRPARRASAGT